MPLLEGKVALVTGSTQGLGEAIVRRFVDEGADGIVVTGRNEGRGAAVARELVSAGCDAIFLRADLADYDDVMSLADRTDAHFGKLDVLVNAAALTWRGSIVDTDLELWNAIMDVNLRAPFFLTQRAIGIMRRENIQGSIVNIGSVASHGSTPGLAPYAISKGALVPFTRNVAHAMTRDRIRVNTLNIGWMNTPGEDEVQRRFHSADDGWLEEAEAAMPLGRLLRPDEVASAVLFLASENSGMMTGSIIEFDQRVVGAGDPPVVAEEEGPR